MSSNREEHPHLLLFDPEKKWQYLIIGTFPPNTALRNQEKVYIDYFYGNKGSFWKIIHDIYYAKGYDFYKSGKMQNLGEIKRWQQDYGVGLSDTISSCARMHSLSSDDSALIDIVYNHALKDHILDNRPTLKKIIFTSSFGKNSAFENFKIIMGAEIILVEDKLVIGLPSPSGSANITFFNTNQEETLGLTRDLYNYVSRFRPELINGFKHRWNLKQQKRSDQSIIIPASPAGLVKEYKIWRYQQVLPSEKCS